MRTTLLIVFAFLAFGCDTAILEEKYIASDSPIKIGDIEIFVNAQGKRKPTEEYRIKEQGPYIISVCFRTNSAEFDESLRNVSIEIVEFNKKYTCKNNLSFGAPSKNPNVSGYRFTDSVVTEAIDINFSRTEKFNVIVSYEQAEKEKTIPRIMQVEMRKKLIKTSTIIANINGV